MRRIIGGIVWYFLSAAPVFEGGESFSKATQNNIDILHDFKKRISKLEAAISAPPKTKKRVRRNVSN